MSDDRPYEPGEPPLVAEPVQTPFPESVAAPLAVEPPVSPVVPQVPAPQPLPLLEPPVVPIPEAPAARPGTGRGAGLAISIALAGVLLSGVVGGAAGYYGSRLGAPASSAGSAITTSHVIANAGEEPAAAAAAVAVPTVVNIDVTTSGSSSSGLPQNHPSVPSGGTGSGVAYKAADDGGTYIITNDHVVGDATEIRVTPPDGDTLTATLVGTDPETDIAVIKVPAKLRTITVASSEQLVVGQTVIAIGSPFGLEHSVSSGVVSALHRSITSSSLDTTAADYSLVDAIQTDAAINPGNSGGALVDRQGRLVGINSAIYTDSGNSAGVGFAIPSKTATRIADELISGGKATHPFLGVEGTTVTPAGAKAAGLPNDEGALVVSVFDGTGASKAGLRKDDIVVGLDDTVIRTMDDLILAVRRHQVGDTVSLTLWRDHAKITVEMTVGDKPSNL